MAKGTNTTTTQASSEPWDKAQPLLEKGMQFGNDLFDTGVGMQSYTGSTAIPWSQNTMSGMGGITALAGANSGGNGLSGQMQGVINNGGYNDAMKSSMDYLNGAGTNPFDLSKNDAYQQYKSATMDDIASRISQQASAAGRYGSGMHTANLARELTNAGNTMDLSQMSRMDSMNAQRANLGQAAFGNLPAAYTNASLPYADQMKIGAMDEDLATRIKNDELRLFNESQNLPWEQLQRLMAVGAGAGSYGTSTTTAQSPGQNPWLTGLGYGLTGLSALGSLTNNSNTFPLAPAAPYNW